MRVYSEDRVRRLRAVLWIVAAVGALVALLAVVTIADGEHRAAGTAGVVVAGLLLGSSGISLRLLTDAARPAKIATVVTAVLAMGCGLVSGSWMAFLLLLVGLGLLFLALLPDVPEGAR
jgi:hypothetical protein